MADLEFGHYIQAKCTETQEHGQECLCHWKSNEMYREC